MLEAKAAEAAELTKETEKATKTLRAKAASYTRLQSVAAALKEGRNERVALVLLSDSIFAARTSGKLNPKEAKADVDRAIRLLVALGLGKVDGTTFVYSPPKAEAKAAA
jgi:hypothetical protein